jgi:Methyltransferase domain
MFWSGWAPGPAVASGRETGKRAHGVSTIHPMAMILVRRFLHAYVETGPKGVCAAIYRKLAQPLRRRRASVADGGAAGFVNGAEVVFRGTATTSVHPFDLEYGTDTSGLITGEDLSSGRWNDLWNTAYYGISPSGFNQIFQTLDLDWRRFTFIDLGSGKGRALLLASRFPFRRIVGVEIAPELSETAAANIERFCAPWQVCREIEAYTGDAAEFGYPAGPFVLFLYQPFLPPVLKRCLKNLARSLAEGPREAYVVYVNPVFDRLMKRVPRLVRQWERSFAYSDEDLRADRVGAKADNVVVYRYLP